MRLNVIADHAARDSGLDVGSDLGSAEPTANVGIVEDRRATGDEALDRIPGPEIDPARRLDNDVEGLIHWPTEVGEVCLRDASPAPSGLPLHGTDEFGQEADRGLQDGGADGVGQGSGRAFCRHRDHGLRLFTVNIVAGVPALFQCIF